ncbi:MAG: SdiA-regulated domain-containing protein [Chitinophagaceae bacterium]
MKLPLELDEISGLAYYAKDTSVFAISDEKGWLYKIRMNGEKEIDRWKFTSKADFEDIVLLDSAFYILESNGIIFKVTFENDRIFSKEIPYPFESKDEYESLYYDDIRKKLIMVCKDCESDKKKSLTTVSFDPVTNEYSDSSSFTIDVKDIAKSLGEDKVRFKPSAAAINPADSLLYIISSVNKIIVVTDRDGHFKSAHPIDPSLFKQAEGLTFSPTGTMMISNEAGGVGVADILIYSNHKIHP